MAWHSREGGGSGFPAPESTKRRPSLSTSETAGGCERALTATESSVKVLQPVPWGERLWESCAFAASNAPPFHSSRLSASSVPAPFQPRQGSSARSLTKGQRHLD